MVSPDTWNYVTVAHDGALNVENYVTHNYAQSITFTQDDLAQAGWTMGTFSLPEEEPPKKKARTNFTQYLIDKYNKA